MKTKPLAHLHVLAAAVLSTLGIVPCAHAVHINAQGTGQVLIYPYYTVRSTKDVAYNTLLTIVNTSSQNKAVKVRFLEGRRGSQVMDFNLYLPPNDVWTGAAVSSTSGTRLLTGDNSCMVPADLFTATGKNEFRNQAYLNDSGPVDLDRTREGHIEVIEMGVVTNTTLISYIKHNSAGIPANCAALNSLETSAGSAASFPAGLAAPSGGLSGRGVIISAANGATYGFDATALDAWSATVQYTALGSEGPLLGAANPPVSEVLTQKGLVRATWNSGRDAVTAALMRNVVTNEYGIEKSTASLTDWVVTFPTKREYVGIGAGLAHVPFSQNFNMTTTSDGGACDSLGAFAYTREGPLPVQPIGLIGVLPGPMDPTLYPCWNANVFSFSDSYASLLASINLGGTFRRDRFTTTAGSATSAPGDQGPNGWAKLTANYINQSLYPLSATLNGVTLANGGGRHQGLPIIALAFTNFRNAGVTSQYGIVHHAKYTATVFLGIE